MDHSSLHDSSSTLTVALQLHMLAFLRITLNSMEKHRCLMTQKRATIDIRQISLVDHLDFGQDR